MQASTEGPVPVAICGAHRLFRDALAAALSAVPEFTVVGAVADPVDLLPLCRLRAPELVLCCADDVPGAALSALAAVRVRCAGARLILIYQELSPDDMAASREAGVDTLIPWSHGLDALLIVLARHHAALRPAGRADGPAPDPPAVLSDREQEVVTLLAAGHPVGRIAELLGVANRVVENHKRRIYQKLAVSSQSHLVARAATLGLIGRHPPVARPSHRPGAVPLVVLHGADDEVRHDVVAALLAAHLPFVVDGPGNPRAELERAHPGPVILVAVDPATTDWMGLTRTGTSMLLVRSTPVSRDETLAALAHGVVGVLAAAQVGTVLVPALYLAAAGHLTLEPVTGAALAAGGVRWGEADGLPELTVRESDILRSIAHGHTVRQTARSLGIAVKTVENTQARLFRKLSARNRAGALATAHALGLLELLDEPPRP
ncbi:LuxR C-terminal-related transcriptional regulator [Jidongwangia harbinensis]|uniref:LuxR C-terminal-related transcriptional regulator n=1 Tax=Jidongwangia harbinensis TaxID=2878561 RepID=UPI001CD94DA7|nr:LuxR C-terminal-related transcriptional regulator [Jidongwangia harbinensis]MCA2212902.1 LuxR C-terminal-related transcriptional regulator [Jidongwangia harbinensis]